MIEISILAKYILFTYSVIFVCNISAVKIPVFQVYAGAVGVAVIYN